MNKRSAPPSLFKPCITASDFEPALAFSFQAPTFKIWPAWILMKTRTLVHKSLLLPGSMRGSPASE